MLSAAGIGLLLILAGVLLRYAWMVSRRHREDRRRVGKRAWLAGNAGLLLLLAGVGLGVELGFRVHWRSLDPMQQDTSQRIRLLGHETVAVRVNAAVSLAPPVDAGTAIPPLVAALDDPTIAVRKAALESIGRHGRNAAAAWERVADCMGERDHSVRVRAQRVFLASLGRAAPIVAARIASADLRMQSEALDTLSQMRPRDHQAIASALAATPTARVVAALLPVLVEVDPAGPAETALVQTLGQSKDPNVRWMAAWAERRSGWAEPTALAEPLVRSAIDALIGGMREGALEWRQRAVWLASHHPELAPKTVPALGAMITEPLMDRVALVALRDLGPAAATAAPAVRKLLDDFHLGSLAEQALARMGEPVSNQGR